MSGKRQTNQQQLASGTDGRGETPVAATRGAEPSVAMTTTESPAFPEHLMEEVCSRENLQRAWKRVQENKGGPGGDGMTIGAAKAFLREHWPEIRKSAVARPEERKFLGFSIANDGSERRIASKALAKFKDRVRDITRRTRGLNLERIIKDLASYLIGWRGYFAFCQTPRVLTNLEAWIRRR